MLHSDEAIRKVAIVGCGVAGLAMAACMKVIPTGVEEVVVFDPHDNIIEHNVGGGIGLTSGAYILEKLGFLDQLKLYGKHIDRIRFVDQNENKLMELNLQEIFQQDQNETFPSTNEKTHLAYTLRWSALRRLLYECTFLTKETIESKLSIDEQELKADHSAVKTTKVIYRPKHRFQSLEEDVETGLVTLYFTNKMRESDFDLVIGADGVRSSVRNFTARPNETIITALPFGYSLPGAFGSLDSGVRVTQCVSPPKSDRPQFQAVAQAEDMTEERLINSVENLCEGNLQQICGDGCNFLTLRVGDFENTYYVMGLIYRQTAPMAGGENVGWIPDSRIKDDIEQRLRNAGVNRFHELHAMLEAASRPGGLIFDVGIKDHLLPLRTWASKSGKVVLIGDSAHAEAPFLGQGANQSIQDAFCLTSLIYEYNRGKPLEMKDKLCPKPPFVSYFIFPWPTLLSITVWLMRFVWVSQVITSSVLVAGWSMKTVIDLAQVRASRPTKLQRMVYKYENIRKYHNTRLTFLARVLGFVETLGGPWGYFLKCSFFRLLHWTGLGKQLFLGPIRPVV